MVDDIESCRNVEADEHGGFLIISLLHAVDDVG